MADELKLGAEAAAGARAEAIIGDPLFADAVRQIRDGIVAEWQNETNPDRRTRLWLEMRLLPRLVGRIRSVMETGKLAQAELGEIEARKGILQRMGLQK